jgi:hypothetical protein
MLEVKMIGLLMMLLAAPPTTATRMKSVVCKALEPARGKSGEELAAAIEAEVTRFASANYVLTGLLPGDPPIACFRGLVDESKLPRGAH